MNISNIIISILLALLPALFWLTVYYKKDYRDPEPKKVIAKTFLMGAVVALPFLCLRFLLPKLGINSLILEGVTTVIIFAALEEIAKLSASIFTVTRNHLAFNQIIDGVVYGVTAALGFAFVENMVYFIEFMKGGASTQSMIYMTAFRSLGTMLAHTLFSGLAGLIWAYAYFSKKIAPFHKKSLIAFELKDFINTEVLSLHILRRNILTAHPSRRGGHEKKIMILEGVILATFFHSIFNLTTTLQILGQTLTFLLVPFIMGLLLYVFYLFEKKFNQKMFHVV